jgi:hypothetical protein
MWGIIPAAGMGTRIQPLAFSKELLPVGSRRDGDAERPRAVSEYLVERMVLAGPRSSASSSPPASPTSSPTTGRRSGRPTSATSSSRRPAGCATRSSARCPLVHPDEPVLVGLPDTIWFPEDGLKALPDDRLAFLMFPVDRPEFFDAVVTTTPGT